MRKVKRWFKGFGRKFKKLDKDEKGLEGLEYLLIAALVIIAAVSAWRFLGEKVDKNVRKVADKVEQATDESIQKGFGGGGS